MLREGSIEGVDGPSESFVVSRGAYRASTTTVSTVAVAPAATAAAPSIAGASNSSNGLSDPWAVKDSTKTGTSPRRRTAVAAQRVSRAASSQMPSVSTSRRIDALAAKAKRANDTSSQATSTATARPPKDAPSAAILAAVSSSVGEISRLTAKKPTRLTPIAATVSAAVILGSLLRRSLVSLFTSGLQASREVTSCRPLLGCRNVPSFRSRPSGSTKRGSRSAKSRDPKWHPQ
jgi:hypothetical protein